MLPIDVCNEQHQQITYTGSPCPLCREIKRAEQLMQEARQYQQEAQFYGDQIQQLEAQIDSYEKDYKIWKQVIDKLEGKTYDNV